jgi:hypothetical protein
MRLSFQMRPKDGRFLVYLIRVNGAAVPVSEQRAVYGPETAQRAQLICDALNRGLYARVLLAGEAEIMKGNTAG